MPPKSQQPTRSSSAQDASINESSTGPRATTSTVDNPSTTAGQSRQGVTRLDTLAKRGGSAAAAKPLKIQPKAVGRRSLLEREEAEREEQRRLDTRTTTAADASGSSSNRGLSGHGRGDSFRARGWQRGGGWFGGRGGTRSGYAMPLPERVGEGMASGPFGAGSVLSGSAKRKLLMSGIRRERMAAMTSSSSRSGQMARTDKEGDVSMTDGGKLKNGDFYGQWATSSDEDDEEDGPRVELELINVISDDEDFKEGDDGKSAERRPIIRPNRGLRPVRLEAREHVKRGAVAIGLGKSSVSSLIERKQAGSPMFVPRDLELEKGRRRVKENEVEFLRGNRTYKGTYPAEGDGQGQVKSEPVDESESMGLEDVSASDPTNTNSVLDKDAQPGSMSEAAKKGKAKSKGILKPSKTRVKIEAPVLQTEEDLEEWERREEDIRMLRYELGLLPWGKSEEDGSQKKTTLDESGDIDMQTFDPREKYGRLYLFQFPPILPPLHNPADLRTESQPPSQTSPPNENQTNIINPNPKSTNQQPPSNKTKTNPSEAIIVSDTTTNKQTDTKPGSSRPEFPSGKVGKLSLRKSGRVTLSWGIPSSDDDNNNKNNSTSQSSTSEKRGLQLQLNRGTDVDFFQNLVLADNILHKQEEEGNNITGGIGGGIGDNNGGRKPRATALGSINAKFVATPDWESLLT